MRTILAVSAIYLAAIGLALMFVPRQFGIGAVPDDATPELIALLRLLGGPFLGIAALNWLSRSSSPPGGVRTVLMANLIGFGAVAASDLHGVLSGEARHVAKYFLVIHLGFTAAFAHALFHRASSLHE